MVMTYLEGNLTIKHVQKQQHFLGKILNALQKVIHAIDTFFKNLLLTQFVVTFSLIFKRVYLYTHCVDW